MSVNAIADKRSSWETTSNSSAFHRRTNSCATSYISIKKQIKLLKTRSFLEEPSFSKSYRVTIPENILVGTVIDTISASDPDGNVLVYTVQKGNINNTFVIDNASGVLRIAKKINYHTQPLYSLTVKASSADGSFAETTVTILVDSTSTTLASSSFVWETVASQPYVVSEAQGKTVNNKLYTFGGFDSQKAGFTPTNRAYVYDPVINKWSALTAMPPMNGTNYGGVTHAGITSDGTDIYIAGGYTSNASGTGQIFGTKEVWKYVVSENRYERLPDLPIMIAAGQLEYLNGQLHHIGGTNQARTQDLGNHYVLNLDNKEAGWKPLAPLPNPRQHAGSAVYKSKIYYIGGQTGHDKKLVAQKEVHEYNPNTNTWIKKADLPIPAGATGRGHISSAVIVTGNQILVLAGETVHSKGQTNLVSAYNPATNTWQNLTPLPQNRFSGVAALLHNSIYYTGGSRTNTTFKSSPVLPPIQDLITDLQANSNKVYSIGELVLGATIYTDQDDQIVSLPVNLDKSIFIKTPNTDKDNADNEVFSFTLTKKATLYIAYDSRATVLPAWLNDWQKSADTLSINDPASKSFHLYHKTVAAGKVTLAGNLAPPAVGALSNYIMIMIPAITTGINPVQENRNTKMQLYPNPINKSDDVTIVLTGLVVGEPVKITLQDVAGRIVETHQARANRRGVMHLKLTSNLLAAGLYLVKAQGTFGKATNKLLIR